MNKRPLRGLWATLDSTEHIHDLGVAFGLKLFELSIRCSSQETWHVLWQEQYPNTARTFSHFPKLHSRTSVCLLAFTLQTNTKYYIAVERKENGPCHFPHK